MPNMLPFEILTVSPVRSLIASRVTETFLIKNYIIIGMGTFLKLFHISDLKREFSIDLFKAASIHGIKKVETTIDFVVSLLIYGQKSIACVDFLEGLLRWEIVVPEIFLEDWILDAKSCSNKTVLVLTSHNKLVHLKLLKEGKSIVLNAWQCEENSLLYSGLICGSSLEACIAIGGTAFGAIVFWTPSLSDALQPFHCIRDIKGAVFCVSFNEAVGLVASTSDDRSVRVWKVSSPDKPCFSNDLHAFWNFWKRCTIDALFCSYGHGSRVWRCLTLDDGTTLSCGEDSFVCHWSLKGTLLSSWDHSGGSIWSIAANEENVYSAGEDGTIGTWCLHPTKGSYVRLSFPPAIYKDHNHETFSSAEDSKDFLRSLNLISSSALIAVSDSGKIWVLENSFEDWKLVYENSILKGYAITAMNQDSTIFVAGTLAGYIIVLSVRNWRCVCLHFVRTGKVQSVMFSDEFLLVCSSSGEIQFFSLQLHDGLDTLRLVQSHTLPPSRRRWASAAVVADFTSVLVGDAVGQMHLYVPQEKNPVCTVKGLHGQEGVTCIKKADSFFITSGRDGFLKFITIQNNAISVLCDMKVSAGNWICGLMNWRRHLILPIFSGERLRLWDMTYERLLCEVECGGGHRAWDISLGSSGRSGDLVAGAQTSGLLTYCFMKNKSPVIFSIDLTDTFASFLQIPFPSGEIGSLESLWTNGRRALVMCGGEDTSLHLQLVEPQTVHKISSLKSHLSSIRSVSKIADSFGAQKDGRAKKEVYVVTCGGRAQTKVWKCSLTPLGEKLLQKDDPGDTFGTLLDPVVWCKEIGSHSLKPESASNWRNKELTWEPETRYMDCLAIWITENEALLILASSDGYIRFIKYLSSSGTFGVLHEKDCSFCVLRLCFLCLGMHLHLAASTTSGNLLLWDMSDIRSSGKLNETLGTKVKKRASFQVDSSGVNSLSFRDSRRPERGILAAGCDSGKVSVLAVVKKTGPNPSFIKCISSATLHSAQVTGLAWISRVCLCSASVDQRVIVWRFEEVSALLSPICVNFTSVADVRGLQLMPLKSDGKSAIRIMVYGSGLQAFDVDGLI